MKSAISSAGKWSEKVMGGGAVQMRESTRARNVGYEAADNLRQFCDGSVQDAAKYNWWWWWWWW